MKCIMCDQRNVDGAIDQHGDFVCVDCFAEGNAKFSGRKVRVLSPVPGYDYSRIDYAKTIKAWNGDKQQ